MQAGTKKGMARLRRKEEGNKDRGISFFYLKKNKQQTNSHRAKRNGGGRASSSGPVDGTHNEHNDNGKRHDTAGRLEGRRGSAKTISGLCIPRHCARGEGARRRVRTRENRDEERFRFRCRISATETLGLESKDLPLHEMDGWMDDNKHFSRCVSTHPFWFVSSARFFGRGFRRGFATSIDSIRLPGGGGGPCGVRHPSIGEHESRPIQTAAPDDYVARCIPIFRWSDEIAHSGRSGLWSHASDRYNAVSWFTRLS